jgi:3'(2'), 5'-bisphosphate nucleotidase
MNSNECHQLLISALIAAKEAGKAILDVYDSEYSVETKDDRSPLTIADIRSHEIIMDHLSSIPNPQSPIPVLSEEGKDIPYSEREKWEDFWLVDPLDGTKEFIKRNGEFTVNIALIHSNRPIMGVIYIPVKNTYYFAIKDFGAYKLVNSEMMSSDLSVEKLVDGAVKLPVPDLQSPITGRDSQITIVGSRSHATMELEQYIEKMRDKYQEVEFVSAGSSLKFCLVAEGSADVYPRYAPTMEWDTAAGQIIAEEAGRTVIRVDNGEPLLYNKEDLKNPWFIVIKGSQNMISALL